MKVDKRTMAKFENWKQADVWSRINISFTTKQREKLVLAGLCKKGPFGSILEFGDDSAEGLEIFCN